MRDIEFITAEDYVDQYDINFDDMDEDVSELRAMSMTIVTDEMISCHYDEDII